jgi:hypothetical protein
MPWCEADDVPNPSSRFGHVEVVLPACRHRDGTLRPA